MPDIIPAVKSNAPYTLLPAQEVLNAPWHDINDGAERVLSVQDFDHNHIEMLQDALSHHGLYADVTKQDGELFLSVDMTLIYHQIAFDALEERPADFLGGVTNYGLGPDPKMLDLDINEAASAQRALQDALAHNEQAGATERGITPEQADTLLTWIVQRARNDLFKDDERCMQTPSTMIRLCGYTQALIGHQAEMMGMKAYYHQANDQSENSKMRHVFNVLKVPIEENDTATSQAFLVDASFRQFFQNDLALFASTDNRSLISPTWGSRLVETPEGKTLADALLSDGYTALTQDNARLYIEAQTFDKHPVTQELHYGEWKTNNPLRALMKNTAENDYMLSELVDSDVDIRTPEMILKDIPLSTLIVKIPTDDETPASNTSPEDTALEI